MTFRNVVQLRLLLTVGCTLDNGVIVGCVEGRSKDHPTSSAARHARSDTDICWFMLGTQEHSNRGLRSRPGTAVLTAEFQSGKHTVNGDIR